MAAQIEIEWNSEDIPNEDLLFMRVHQGYFDSEGNIIPGAFRNRSTPRDGMSTDWQKYSLPEETRSRARAPGENAVIQFAVGEVLGIPNQTVAHTPDVQNNNRADTDVFGEKHTEARVKFCRIAKLVIPLVRNMP